MIKKQYFDIIQETFNKAVSKRGLDLKLSLENVYYEFSVIRVPKEIANRYPDELSSIHDEVVSSLDFLDELNSVDHWRGCRICGTQTRNLEYAVKKGYFTSRKEDDEAIERENQRVISSSRDSERPFWRDYIIPIPPPRKNAPSELFLTMAYEPYDQIKNGEKVTEFRRYTENWVKRILSNPPKTIRFQRGYGGPGRPKPEQMVWTVKENGISLYELETRKSCDPWKLDVDGILPDFIAMDLGRRIS